MIKQKYPLLLALVILSIPISQADPYKDYLHTPVSAGTIPGFGRLLTDPNTGSAVYSYPITVPPGTRGLQPTLALTYNSFAANSYPELTGSGWSLTQNYIQRNAEYTPDSTSDDTYTLTLNGASYKLFYDSADDRYHTKQESNMWIKKLSGGSNAESQYWEIKTKDGTTYRFGYSSDSAMDSNQNSYVWRWYLGTITDTHENRIYYSYRENPYSEEVGTTYLDKIEYNNDKTRKITFTYEALPASWTIFDNGHKIKRTQRLREITTYAGGSKVRTYAISYTTNDAGTRSTISSITEKGSDGTPLQPTTFSYTEEEAGWERAKDIEENLPGVAYFSYNEVDGGGRLTDLNRDGMIDLIYNRHYVYVGGGAYLQSIGGRFTADSGFTPPEEARFIEDYDRLPVDWGVRIGDYNGDGYPDLIQGFEDEDGVEYYKMWENTGSGWRLSSRRFVTIFNKLHDRPVENEDQGVQLIDLNGDGYVDVVKARDGEPKQTWINTHSGWTIDSKWNLPSGVYFIEHDGDDEGVRFIDLNNDGLADLYRSDDDDNKDLWLNTGSGWEKTTEWPISMLPDNVDLGNDDEGVRFVDINRDGLEDVIQDRSGGSRISTGNSWTAKSEWEVPENAEFVDVRGNNEGTRLADINGDGSTDIVRIKSESGIDFKLAWTNKMNKPRLLEVVKTSTGGEHYIDYMNSGETPDNKIGFNQWIVRSISSNPNAASHHESNEGQDCEPAQCPAGYEDGGVTCSPSQCTRLCEVKSCGSWALVSDAQNPWSAYNFDSEIGKPLFTYSSFNPDSCYKVESWSDSSIIDDSDIDGEDTSETDAAIVLIWSRGDYKDQTWGGHCEPDETGFLIGHREHYLIDDKDDRGNDFNSAEDLGGSWIGYCMPPSEGCSGYSRCTTECYNTSWEFKIYAYPAMMQGYEPSDPGDKDGACNANNYYKSDADTDYIDFERDRYVGMRVWRAPMVTSGSQNQICQKKPVKRTSYTYTGGLYDFEKKEYRGFSQVEETLPDSTRIKHYFHQDDARSGTEHQTETKDASGNVKLRTDNTISSTNQNRYYTIRIDSTKQTRYDGPATVTQTDFQYDSYGNPTKILEFGDTSTPADDRFIHTTYNYDTSKWIVNKPLRVSTYGPDDSTKAGETSYTYNAFGDAIREEKFLNTGANPTKNYEHDGYGNVIRETDPLGHSTSYAHDSTNTFITSTTNAKNQVSTFTTDQGTGNLLSSTYPNGNTVRYSYDTLGRKTKEIQPYDSETYPTVEYTYVFDGNAPEEVRMKQREQGGTPNTIDVYTFFDGFGKRIQTKMESDDPGKFIIQDIYYDKGDRIKKESNPYSTSSSSYTTPQSVPSTAYEYDTLGRNTKTTSPDLTTVRIEYTGWTRTVFDKNNHRTDYTTDGRGNIAAIKEYSGGNVYTTSYSYSPKDEMTRIQDANGNQVTYMYDTLGRKTEMQDPDLGRWTYAHDGAGNLMQQTDARGDTVQFTYDVLNRPLTKSGGASTINYVYDRETIGTLSEVQTPAILTKYFYDNRLRTIKEEKTIDGITFTTQKTYDSANRVTSKTLPDWTKIDYGYNKQGQLASVSDVVHAMSYNDMGLPTERTYANGLSTQMIYNTQNNRLTGIKTGSIQDLSYQYDNAGNTLRIDDKIAKFMDEMGYDDRNQLLTAKRTDTSAGTQAYNLAYSYDPVGNMLSSTNLGEPQVSFAYSIGHAPRVVNVSGERDGKDGDNDGIPDMSDQCPNTPAGEGVNSQGCSCSQIPQPGDDGNICTVEGCISGSYIKLNNDSYQEFVDCPGDGCAGNNWIDYPPDGYTTCQAQQLVNYSCNILSSIPDERCNVDSDNDGHSLPNDCNDENPSINPEAVEVCNGVDDNCNEEIDENLTGQSRECASGVGECGASGVEYKTCNGVLGWSEEYSGCTAVPGEPSPEACDHKDNNCDGAIDEGTEIVSYMDNDQDGFGVDSNPSYSCEITGGFSTVPGDCNDDNDQINPNMRDLFNYQDDDCDEEIDEDAPAVSYELVRGLNFIGIPYDTEMSLNGLEDEIGPELSFILYYDYEKGKFISRRPEDNVPDRELGPYEGYLLVVKSPVSLTLKGKEREDSRMNLHTGINPIRLPEEDAGKTIVTLLNEEAYSNVKMIVYLDTSKQRFRAVTADMPEESGINKEIKSNEGYLLIV